MHLKEVQISTYTDIQYFECLNLIIQLLHIY